MVASAATGVLRNQRHNRNPTQLKVPSCFNHVFWFSIMEKEKVILTCRESETTNISTCQRDIVNESTNVFPEYATIVVAVVVVVVADISLDKTARLLSQATDAVLQCNCLQQQSKGIRKHYVSFATISSFCSGPKTMRKKKHIFIELGDL